MFPYIYSIKYIVIYPGSDNYKDTYIGIIKPNQLYKQGKKLDSLNRLSQKIPLEKLPDPLAEAIPVALGQTHRKNPTSPKTGGAAGNARITAWSGILLLILLFLEGLTLVSIRHFVQWHIILGTLMIPPTLLKIATTFWRFIRYYSGNRQYKIAGPPPLVLRLLGPFMIISTLGVLGSGIALVFLGPLKSTQSLITIAGISISMIQLHKIIFVIWFIVTTFHVLGRFIPAIQNSFLQLGGKIAGWRFRALAIYLAVVTGVMASIFVLDTTTSWQSFLILHKGIHKLLSH